MVKEPATARPGAGAAPLPVDELLLRSLEELAAAGNVEAACRLAGHACVTLRHDAKAEHRFNALLHRLTRRLSW